MRPLWSSEQEDEKSLHRPRARWPRPPPSCKSLGGIESVDPDVRPLGSATRRADPERPRAMTSGASRAASDPVSPLRRGNVRRLVCGRTGASVMRGHEGSGVVICPYPTTWAPSRISNRRPTTSSVSTPGVQSRSHPAQERHFERSFVECELEAVVEVAPFKPRDGSVAGDNPAARAPAPSWTAHAESAPRPSAWRCAATGSDTSERSLARATKTARELDGALQTARADFRDLSAVDDDFDVVISCDNAIPHLLRGSRLAGSDSASATYS